MTITEQRTAERERRWPRNSLAAKAAAIESRVDESPWEDHEYVRGYGVMVLPFSSGHLLALRVSPQNPFAPYTSVWHRPPDGEWSIFVDGPSLEIACPRYWGPVAERTELANVEVTWTGPSELRVEVDEPSLTWTTSISAPTLRRAANEVNASLPLWTWKPDLLVRAKEWLARRVLGVGDIEFSFGTPSGHDTVLAPEEEYVISDAEAILNGRSLGEPVRLDENPTIGDVRLPTRPSFVFAQAHMRITDSEEYHRTRERVRED